MGQETVNLIQETTQPLRLAGSPLPLYRADAATQGKALPVVIYSLDYDLFTSTLNPQPNKAVWRLIFRLFLLIFVDGWIVDSGVAQGFDAFAACSAMSMECAHTLHST